MNNQLKLKSCPFCGNEDLLVAQPSWPSDTKEWYVNCGDLCGLIFYIVGSKELLITNWNKRVGDK